MARRRAEEDEFEEEYEEEYEGGSIADAFASSSWRRAIIVPLILVLFGFGTWMLWKRNRDNVFGHSSYQLAPENIAYTLPPDWIKRDILGEVLKLGSLEAKGIHDDGVTAQVAGAFEHHPWVKEVERVRIMHPAKLQVKLTYRSPVAMVTLPDDNPDDDEALMLPIDESAVQLPWEDFTEDFANDGFPRIDVGNTYPTGPVGSIWGDKVVEHAAKIAEVLHADWANLKDVLHRIERSSQPTSTSDKTDFDIIGKPSAKSGHPMLIVHWGRAPGEEQAGEPTAKSKLKRLKEWVNDAKLSGYAPVGEIDLRSVRSMQESLQAARTQSQANKQARAKATQQIR